MVKFNPVSLFVPSGKNLEQATQNAIKNIYKQLAKRPVIKKNANAVDFSWIYKDPAQFRPHIIGSSRNKLETFV